MSAKQLSLSKPAGISPKEVLVAIMGPIPAQNRRITPLADGWAAICDDAKRTSGLGVIVDGEINRLANVRKADNRYLTDDGQPVIFKGWVLATVRGVGTPAEGGSNESET